LLARIAYSSLRSQLASLASLDEDENTRDESREIATDIMAATSIHYKVFTIFHSNIILTRFAPRSSEWIDPLISKLNTVLQMRTDPNLANAACWVLGNLAGDADEVRQRVLSSGSHKLITVEINNFLVGGGGMKIEQGGKGGP